LRNYNSCDILHGVIEVTGPPGWGFDVPLATALCKNLLLRILNDSTAGQIPQGLQSRLKKKKNRSDTLPKYNGSDIFRNVIEVTHCISVIVLMYCIV